MAGRLRWLVSRTSQLRRSRSPHRAYRLPAVVLGIWLPLAGLAPAASAIPVHWPALPFTTLTAWLTGDTAPSPKLPVQETGTAAGRPHLVPASATRSVSKAAGHAPGRGPGQLPAYAPHPPSGHTLVTGPAATDGSTSFSPQTSTLVASGSTATSSLYRNKD